MTETNASLDNAPDEVKLAVDLIYLLESNQIEIETALKALKIVENDLKNKQSS
ncbi:MULTISPECIES: pleiotropic regulatory protein RsmS [unclassified Vibrio]|uniref:Pleiotropic regulatory protein RsmS n=1 Tax=Vibrio sp. HB236076 TaxID=3232307 RepID=A0AB39HFC1_9VIBR|nr:pleiotropic regulatory protein RsmS [Vibrio sp. HB161653]MDP5255084.1 pleiotropic regulatory protein RsmS [Vibrio sp. HB161653]